MKIEMGESLIQSWLKHTCKCHITQLNWKVSSSWSPIVSESEIKKLFNSLKKNFRLSDNDFVSRKMSLSQFIQQGEADCVGIKLSENNPAQVEKIFAVDVAFHEGGLNYGGKEETKARIIKKNIRTALTIYQYLGAKDATIVFATPIVLNAHVDLFLEATRIVEHEFKQLGFNYTFKFYCNEAFFKNIYSKVLNVSQEMTDTSELFSRSLKMVSLMNTHSIDVAKNETETYSVTDLESDEEVKIGAMVRNAFLTLVENELLKDDDAKQLCNEAFSRKTFAINFPVLIEKVSDSTDGMVGEYRRYYRDSYIINGKEYLLCNHWYKRNRSAFEKWYSQF